MTGWLDQPLLDLDRVDLDAADSVTYLLHQVFRYEYDGPAYDLRQRLVGAAAGPARQLPPAGPARLRGRSGGVLRQPSARTDADGNAVVSVELPVVPSSVEFTLAALVERVGPAADPVLPAAALTDPRHLVPTKLTSPSPALWELAESCGRVPGRRRRWPTRCACGCGASSPSPSTPPRSSPPPPRRTRSAAASARTSRT